MNKTKDYINKRAEKRKVRLIRVFIPYGYSILDLGCGPGEYGPELIKKCLRLIGIDYDKELLKVAKKRWYSKLIRMKVEDKLPFKDNEFDSTWSSEFLEHLPNLNILCELERVTKQSIVITIPNPLSPHFKRDKTHILKYSVRGLKRYLKKRKGWSYKVIGLGFDDIPVPQFLKDMTSLLLYYIPELSPTIGIIGKRDEKGKK